MLLEALRTEVLEANLEIVRRGLVLYTFGNASGVSRQDGLIVIKPSGVPYEEMTAADLVVTDLNGQIVEGSLRPSSDLSTHAALYRAFPSIGGVVHTHSRHATAWAQACREIPCFGTTHADYFCGGVPVTACLSPEEIAEDYELNTGLAIIRIMESRDPLGCPAALVAGHAPFCWGRTVTEAAHNAVIVEELAAMAWQTLTINPSAQEISEALRDKHYLRKHGPKATYGQPRPKITEMPARPNIDQQIRTAIEQRRLMELVYQHKPRIIEPHDYGILNGTVMLLAYQVAGSSSGPLPSWRWMEVDSISNLRLLDQTFPGGRPRSDKHRWDRLFVRVAAASPTP